ncbi:RNA polymerase factor sigma-54 [Roseicyclus sp.]|uniref:RNA polymerase factor sigma-54 n=1 Tax=Roseicyclus sp. TaxID=1914329 RepID=UPI003F6D12B4
MQYFPAQQLQRKQSLVITTQLQQAIRLLTMSNIELRGFLDQQTEENPFLEVTGGAKEDEQIAPVAQPEAAKDGEALDFDSGTMHGDTPITEAALDNQFETGQIDLGRSGASGPVGDGDFDALSLIAADEELSLYAHACAEAERLFTDPTDKMIALALIDALEPSGWLGQTLADIAGFTLVAVDRVETVLARLQQIEPAGLFARDLSDCLRLQAREREMLTPDFTILLDNLAMLGAGNVKGLARLCKATPERMAEMLRLLRSLDPKPGARFTGKAEPILPPDLIVRRLTDGWSVELNRSTLPAIKVRQNYAKQIVSGKKDDTLRSFVSERVSEARWLDRAIAQRNDTALKVGTEILRQQIGFFEKGPAALKPMVLRDIAEAIGMHESTISRVTNSLMIATPRGTFRLKAFFSSSITNDADSDGEAASAIRFKLRKLVAAEAPAHPLSDDAIVQILAKDGIRLARRTVAKYREMEGIASSFQRKRTAVLSGRI